MPGVDDGEDVFRVVHRRADVLAALTDGPVEKRDLVPQLSVSRSTVDRALRTLRVHSLVDRTADGFQATLPGRLALAEYERIMASIADTQRARAVLDHIPPTAPLSPALVQGAEVYLPEPPAPRRPLERLRDLVATADRYRGFGKAVLEPNYVSWLLDRTRTGELQVTYVNSRSIATYLADAHEDLLLETLDTDHYRMYVSDELPFDFGIINGAETWVYVIAAGEDASFKGLLLNDDPAAVDWAETLFDRYRDRAVAYDPED